MIPHRDAGFAMLRTPRLPLAAVLANGGADAGSTWAERRLASRRRLAGLLARSDVAEAIALASPEMGRRIPDWLETPGPFESDRIEASLWRYVTRMASRATPFGVFAGVSLGRIGHAARACLADCDRRVPRLDMEVLHLLARHLAEHPALHDRAPWRPNPTLVRVAGRLRYVETLWRGTSRSFRLAAAEQDDAMRCALEAARGGAPRIRIAEALLAFDPEIARDEADAYVGELVAAGLLESDWQPNVTGPPPVAALTEAVANRDELGPVADALNEACEALDALAAAPPGCSVESYAALDRALERLPVSSAPGRRIQVDLWREAEFVLPAQVIDEVRLGVEAVHALFGRERDDPLERFRDAFVARWECAEVPLLEALDDEIGIPVPGVFTDAPDPLVAGLPVGGPPAEPPAFGETHRWLLTRLHASWSCGARVIELAPEEWRRERGRRPLPLGPATGALVSVAAPDAAAIDRGDYALLLHSFHGPSGVELAGRFCGADRAFEASVRGFLARADAGAPDAIHAEIAHLPEGRHGNVLLRPALRHNEIAFFARPGVSSDGVVELSDLMLSVRGGRLVLRSRSRDREVIPHLTSAHNFGILSLPLYRFLGMLQMQGLSASGRWDWGPFSTQPFLPRVTCGRLVLARATWNLEPEATRTARAARGEARFDAVQALRATRDLPRFVLLVQGDNELLADLDDPGIVEGWVEALPERGLAVLVECFPTPDTLWVQGPHGRHSHEVLVPLEQPAAATHLHVTPRPRAHGHRPLPPGSDCAYVKLYTGVAASDRLLAETVRGWAAALGRALPGARMFFVRYADPDWHVRVRVLASADDLRRHVWPLWYDDFPRLLAEGLVQRVQTDTYVREVSRYGGSAGLEACETLFSADSATVLDALAGPLAALASGERWRWALAALHRLLDGAGLDGDAALALCERQRAAYFAEFGASHALHVALGQRFRERRRDIEQVLAAPDADLREWLDLRSQALASGLDRLRALEAGGGLTSGLADVLGSVAHMQVNRLLRTNHRRAELVLYDALERTLRSARARRRDSAATVGAG